MKAHTKKGQRTQQQKPQSDKSATVPAPLFDAIRKYIDVKKLDTYSEPGNRLLSAIVAYGCATFAGADWHSWVSGDAWLCFNFSRLAGVLDCDEEQVPTMLSFLQAGEYIKTERVGHGLFDNMPRAAYIKLNLGEGAQLVNNPVGG